MDKKNIVNTKAYFEVFLNYISEHKNAKSVALIGIGSRKVLFDFRQFFNPDTDIWCFEDKSLEKFCNIMPKTHYNNIIEDDFDLDQFKKDMSGKKFDCIIMNPPYNKGLHLDILFEAIKHGKDIINLSPVTEVQKAILFNNDKSLLPENFEILKTFDVEESSRLFNISIRQELGLWHISNNVKTDWNKLRSQLIKNIDIVLKVYSKLNGSLKSHLTLKPNSNTFLKFGYNVSTYNNGKITSSTFRYVSANYETATQGVDKGHTLYLNFKSEDELKNAHTLYTCEFFRWFSLYGLLCTTSYDFFPWISDYTHPWTDEMLYKHFEFTEEEIKQIEKETSAFIK